MFCEIFLYLDDPECSSIQYTYLISIFGYLWMAHILFYSEFLWFFHWFYHIWMTLNAPPYIFYFLYMDNPECSSINNFFIWYFCLFFYIWTLNALPYISDFPYLDNTLPSPLDSYRNPLESTGIQSGTIKSLTCNLHFDEMFPFWEKFSSGYFSQ